MSKDKKAKDPNKKGLVTEFKEFISRGNVVDMAVGIIIGSAFTAIVTSVVNDLIMPLVGIIIGGLDFSSLALTVGNGEGAAVLKYGAFIQSVINFLIIAICVFAIIKILNTVAERAKKLTEKQMEAEAKIEIEVKTEAPPEPPKPSNEEILLTEIRDLLIKQNEK